MTPAVSFIFVTVFLDMLALGVMIPVLPRPVVEFLGGDNARAATICGAFGTVWALMQFVFSPVVGATTRAPHTVRVASREPDRRRRAAARLPIVLGLAIAAFLSRVAHDALPGTFVLYATYRYGWDERAIRFTLTAVGVGHAEPSAPGVAGVRVREVMSRGPGPRTGAPPPEGVDVGYPLSRP